MQVWKTLWQWKEKDDGHFPVTNQVMKSTLVDAERDIVNWRSLNETDSITCPSILAYVKEHLSEWSGWYGKFTVPGFKKPIELWLYGDRRTHMTPENIAKAVHFVTHSFYWLYTHVLPFLDPDHVFSRGRKRRPRSMKIVLWFTPITKRWNPTHSETLGPCQVNSGQTTFEQRGERFISIWRHEEWSKIWIHELLHALNWDSFVYTALLRRRDSEWSKTLARGKWHEMWTELWADWFHVLYSARVWSEVHILWAKEMSHIQQQALCLYERLNVKQDLIVQHSAVWSYFILKYAVLWYGLDHGDEAALLDFITDDLLRFRNPTSRLARICLYAWEQLQRNYDRDHDLQTSCPISLRMSITKEFV